MLQDFTKSENIKRGISASTEKQYKVNLLSLEHEFSWFFETWASYRNSQQILLKSIVAFFQYLEKYIFWRSTLIINSAAQHFFLTKVK